MNFFASYTAAKRYAAGRPFFHPIAIEKIRTGCCKNGRVHRALDVGCGTGQSTMALVEIAEEIVGVDSSREMLTHASRHPRIRFIEGRAEQMPFVDAEFELVTVGLAFHWFDQRKFLLEARRVLQPGGWLIIYNDVFTGRMEGNDDCEKWYREEYLARCPAPPRNVRAVAEIDTSEFGFLPFGSEDFTHEIEFSLEQLIAYLITQTNVICAVEAGKDDLESVTKWLRDCAAPMFSSVTKSFPFRCQMQFFRRN